jgi:hypothetical protein
VGSVRGGEEGGGEQESGQKKELLKTCKYIFIPLVSSMLPDTFIWEKNLENYERGS